MKPLPVTALILLALPMNAAPLADPPKVLVSRDKAGVALQGYDPVAYLTEGRARKGDPRFHHFHAGGIYYFASEGHRTAFEADPARYAPAFGGYSAQAVANGRLAPGNPTVFHLAAGRLLLQESQGARAKWDQNPEDLLAKAEANWPSLVAQHGFPLKPLLNVDGAGLALEGYDPVAYFLLGRPVKGEPAFEARHGGGRYRFMSAAHRAAFEREPAKYLPAFGGYCGYAASIGKVRPVNPLLWSIVDGQLILQHSKGAVELWEKDVPGNKARATRFWPRLGEAKAGLADPLDGLLGSSVLPEAR